MNNSNTNWQSSSATGSPDNPTFIDLTKPQVVDVEQLEQCADHHVAPNPQDDETAVFHLVGRVDGVISRGPAPTQNNDGACVLYMSADGEAFERHIPAVGGDWSDIPRSTEAPVGHKQATKWMRMAYDHAMEAHAALDEFRTGSEIHVADNGAEIMTDGGKPLGPEDDNLVDHRCPRIGVKLLLEVGDECPNCLKTVDKSDDVASNPELMTDGGEDVDVDELPPLHVGDHVVDREEADEAARMLVVGFDTPRADRHQIGDDGPTVAALNPSYPETDDVVGVSFPQRSDLDVDMRKRYAYPRCRLRLTQPIHEREGGEAADVLTIDKRLSDIEERLDRAERDIDIIDGGI